MFLDRYSANPSIIFSLFSSQNNYEISLIKAPNILSFLTGDCYNNL